MLELNAAQLNAMHYLYDGDRDVEILYRTFGLVRVKFKQKCCSCYHAPKVGFIPAGEIAARETAWVSEFGKFCTSYTCLTCLKRAEREIA